MIGTTTGPVSRPGRGSVLTALGVALVPMAEAAASYWSTRDAIGAVIDPLLLLLGPPASGAVVAILLHRALRPLWSWVCAVAATVAHFGLLSRPGAGAGLPGVPWLSVYVAVPVAVWAAASAFTMLVGRRRRTTARSAR